jgi:predicted amidohydrolase
VNKTKEQDKEVKMIFFPECFAFMGDGKSKGNAESLDGDLFARYRKLAAQHNIWISYGGFPERSTNKEDVENNRGYNTHIIVNDQGEQVVTYRKVHLFDVNIPERSLRLLESETTLPGSQIVTCESPIGTLGVTICYDLRFPEIYTYMALNGGVKVLLVPSAFTIPTGRAHWHVLLRSRAIENQCFVIAAAQTGVHNEKRSTYGHSLVIDPWGEILCDMEERSNDVQIVELNMDRLETVRKEMPVLKHRRGDIYNLSLITNDKL